MNCPHCQQRNPSSAKRCLHCNALFEQEKESMLDAIVDSDDGGANKLFWIIGGVFALIIGGSMLIFGFDTYDGKCARSEAAASKYEADPQWERDESAERREFSRERERYRKQTGNTLRTSRAGFLQCYRKKTGHVDGLVE